MTLREECLQEAINIVTRDRNNQYGKPEDNFGITAELWSAYLNYGLTERDVTIMMALLKIARIATGEPKKDSYIDLAGYAACGMEVEFRDVRY